MKFLKELILYTCVATLAAFVYGNLTPHRPVAEKGSRVGRSPLRSGDPVLAKLVPTDGGPVRFILFTSSKCPHCRRSRDFHNLLVSTAAKHRVGVGVVLSGDDSLGDIGMHSLPNVRIIRAAELKSAPVAVPSIVSLDVDGRAMEVWTGRLPTSDAELAILDRIPVIFRVENESIATAVRDRLKQGIISVIDLRERTEPNDITMPNDRGKVMRIPASEIDVRAPHELLRTQDYVVDCSSVEAAKCDEIIYSLAKITRSVHPYRRGTMGEFCEKSPRSDE